MASKDYIPKKLAVVTGASSGIGFELAKQFAEHGFNLLICAENPEIQYAASELRNYGVQVEGVQVDLATRGGVEELYSKIAGRPIGAVALNAGVGVGGKSFDKSDIEEEFNLINLNITSWVYLTKLVLRDMLKAGQGKLLFTSSIASTMPGPYYAVYAASKAFIQSFAEAIRFEVKDKGITVTSLMPGATDTNFFKRADMENTEAGRAKKDAPALVAKQGFEALMAGRDHVVAGSIMNNVQAGVAKIVPQTFGAKLHAGSTKPKDTAQI